MVLAFLVSKHGSPSFLAVSGHLGMRLTLENPNGPGPFWDHRWFGVGGGLWFHAKVDRIPGALPPALQL
jgi:hypothetical protein